MINFSFIMNSILTQITVYKFGLNVKSTEQNKKAESPGSSCCFKVIS